MGVSHLGTAPRLALVACNIAHVAAEALARGRADGPHAAVVERRQAARHWVAHRGDARGAGQRPILPRRPVRVLTQHVEATAAAQGLLKRTLQDAHTAPRRSAAQHAAERGRRGLRRAADRSEGARGTQAGVGCGTARQRQPDKRYIWLVWGVPGALQRNTKGNGATLQRNQQLCLRGSDAPAYICALSNAVCIPLDITPT
eukprot:92151-Chlamydomonas_euryale.AAC.1